MIKSMSASSKAEIRKNSAVQYDFSQLLQNIPEINRNVNKRIQKYEEYQSLSIRRARNIRSY